MKHLRQKIFTAWNAFFEKITDYFLATHTSLDRHSAKALIRWQRLAPTHQDILEPDLFGERDDIIVIVSPRPFESSLLGTKRSCILLTPRYLEQIEPMIDAIYQSLGQPITLVLQYTSRLPTRVEDAREGMLSLLNDDHHLQFAAMLSGIKRCQVKYGISVTLIEHSEELKEKNSAVLRRIFPD